MPDISQSSQAIQFQALTQSSQLTPTSEVARQGVDVLVKHLDGNVLSINTSTVLLNKTVLLNNPKIKGQLPDSQTHQLKLSLVDDPSLLFFSQTSTKSVSVIPLTEQQLQRLLLLPAKQLISSSLMTKSDITKTLPVINATVLSTLSKEQLNAGLSQEVINTLIKTPTKTPATSNSIEVNHSNLTHNQNILRVSLTDQRPAVEITLPLKQLNQFAVGEKVTLALVPKGNNWQLTVIQNKVEPPNRLQNTAQDKVQIKGLLASCVSPPPIFPNKITDQKFPGTAHTDVNLTDSRVTPTPNIRAALTQQSLLSPLLAVPIIKASMREASQVTPVTVELPVKPVLQQLLKINNEQNHDLIQKLQTLSIEKISLQIKPTGEIDLVLQSNKPVATIIVNKEIAQALAPLKLPNQPALIKRLDLLTKTNQSIQSHPQDTPSPLNPIIQKQNQQNQQNQQRVQSPNTHHNMSYITPPVDASQSPQIILSLKEAQSNLLSALRDTPLIQSVVSTGLLANKTQQIHLIHSLLRIVRAKAQAPAISLQSVEKALIDPAFFNGDTEQPSKQQVEQVFQQIKQALPQGKEQDVNQIKQLLTTPALNLSALQMINPTSSQGFMSGLITVLQMSLSARLTRNQPSHTERITAKLNNVLGAISKTKSGITAKAMGEISQLEQKHQLIKEIGRLFSEHQTNKLINAEQMIQGQDTFYYNLPSALGGTIHDIELLIKREHNNEENASAEQQNIKTWQLTMKLGVGELGELLTKAKLRSNTLEINFYASNETVKIQVMNYLPLLRRKLDSLGIELNKSHCQLGKIPDTLQQRPYNMFQAKA
jgi:hypothetical protein